MIDILCSSLYYQLYAILKAWNITLDTQRENGLANTFMASVN